MALPYEPVRARLSPDDVRSVELLNDLYGTHDDAVDLLAREHFIAGSNRGKHDVIVVPTAVARVEFAGITSDLRRHPEPGDMRVVWAAGFARGPELVVGRHAFYAPDQEQDGVFIEWEIADRRARNADPWSVQICTSTPSWNGALCGFIPMFEAERSVGALRIADTWVDPDEGPMPAPELVPLKALTIAVYLALPPAAE